MNSIEPEFWVPLLLFVLLEPLKNEGHLKRTTALHAMFAKSSTSLLLELIVNVESEEIGQPATTMTFLRGKRRALAVVSKLANR